MAQHRGGCRRSRASLAKGSEVHSDVKGLGWREDALQSMPKSLVRSLYVILERLLGQRDPKRTCLKTQFRSLLHASCGQCVQETCATFANDILGGRCRAVLRHGPQWPRTGPLRAHSFAISCLPLGYHSKKKSGRK